MNYLAALILVLFSLSLGAQDKDSYFELHRKLREQMLKGFQDHDKFMQEMDSLMDQMMRDSFGQDSFLKSIDVTSSGVTTAWSEDKEGRVLEITPADKDMKLDVQVKQGVLVIEGETRSQSSRGRFSQSQSIPSDCDPDRVEMKGEEGKLIVRFPWRKDIPEIKTQKKTSNPKPLKGPIDT
jgi:HSP20 family molecular chaperone IbpA